jgi:outer membrane protein TolC
MLGLVVSMVTTTAVVWTQQSDAGASADDETPVLKELLTQRRDTLQRLLELRSEQFRSGQGSYRDVQDVVNELIDAKLQLATDHTARINLLQEHVKSLRKFEEATESLVKVGQGSQADVLVAQAARLKAQIRLVQEESNDN